MNNINQGAAEVAELIKAKIEEILVQGNKNPDELALIPGLVDAYLRTSLRSLSPGGLKSNN